MPGALAFLYVGSDTTLGANVQYNYAHNFYSSFVFFRFSSNFVISNNEISHTDFGATGQAIGMILPLAAQGPILIERNWIHSEPGNLSNGGIVVVGAFIDVTIADNLVENFQKAAISLGNEGSILKGNIIRTDVGSPAGSHDAGLVLSSNGSNTEVTGNLVYNNNIFDDPAKAAIRFPDQATVNTATGIVMRGNEFFSNSTTDRFGMIHNNTDPSNSIKDAQFNWWGDASGPATTPAPGTQDAVNTTTLLDVTNHLTTNIATVVSTPSVAHDFGAIEGNVTEDIVVTIENTSSHTS